MDRRTVDERITAYLDDELSSSERAEVDRLLNDSPPLRQKLEQMRKLRTLLNELPRHSAPPELADSVLGDLERQMLLSDDLDNPPGTGSPGRWSRYLAVAAVLVLSAGVGFAVYNMLNIDDAANRTASSTTVARNDWDSAKVGGDASSPPAPTGGRMAMKASEEVEKDLAKNADLLPAAVPEINEPLAANEELVDAPAIDFEAADEVKADQAMQAVTGMDESRETVLTETPSILTAAEADDPSVTTLRQLPLDTQFANTESGMLDQKLLAEHQFEIEPLVVELETEDLGRARKHIETTLLNNDISDVTSLAGGVYVSDVAQVYYRGVADKNFRTTAEVPQEQYLARVPNRVLPAVLTQLERGPSQQLIVRGRGLEHIYGQRRDGIQVHAQEGGSFIGQLPATSPKSIAATKGEPIVNGFDDLRSAETTGLSATSQATTQAISKRETDRQIANQPLSNGKTVDAAAEELVTVVIQLRQPVVHSQPVKALLQISPAHQETSDGEP